MRHAIWLLIVSELHATTPDRAVLSVMQRSVPDVQYVQVLKRVIVSPELALVVALGTPNDQPAAKGDSGGGATVQL